MQLQTKFFRTHLRRGQTKKNFLAYALSIYYYTFFPIYHRQRDQWLTERGWGRNLTEDCAAKYGGPRGLYADRFWHRSVLAGNIGGSFGGKIWRMDGIEKQIHHTVSGCTGIHHTLKWKYWERGFKCDITIYSLPGLATESPVRVEAGHFCTAPAVLVRNGQLEPKSSLFKFTGSLHSRSWVVKTSFGLSPSI